jgi:O-antigen ligase
MRLIGFYFALILIFLRVALLSEVITFKTETNFRLVLIFGASTLLLLLLSGGVRHCFRGTAALCFCGYLTWLLVAAPFSVWKGGSFDTLRAAFLTEFSLFFVVVGLTRTLEELRKMCTVIAAGGTLTLIFCRLMGSNDTGRLSLPFGTLQNPNDLAIHLLLVLPFVALVFYAGKGVARLVAMPTAVGLLYAVLLTGSRMALVVTALLVLFILIRSTMTQRLVMIGVFAVASGIALVSMPALTIQRYLTVFSSQPQTIVDMDEYQGAVGSTEARMALLRTSIKMTLQNPLFGAGPGQFAVEEEALQRSIGRRGSWQVTHNTYTQVSSEAGIPALLFYCAAILAALFGMHRIYKFASRRNDSNSRMLVNMAYFLRLALVTIALCSMFGSLAYRSYLPMILGLAVAFTAAAERFIQQMAAEQQSATPIPATNTRPALPSQRPNPRPTPIVGPGRSTAFGHPARGQ